MSKTIANIEREEIEKFGTDKNTFDDFEIGTKVKVITPCQDFNFFYGETGTVIENRHCYLGIKVKFDKPRKFKSGYTQYTFNFEPEDLFILKNVAELFHRVLERNYKY